MPTWLLLSGLAVGSLRAGTFFSHQSVLHECWMKYCNSLLTGVHVSTLSVLQSHLLKIPLWLPIILE